jgi:P27 family predicted phage terminase small subunit
MGKRASKATGLKVIEGNLGRRPLPENEPRPAPVIPECPKDIDPKAKRVFRRLSPILTRIGLLTEVDDDMLGVLCQTRSRLEMIFRRLRRIDLDLKRYQKRLASDEACDHDISMVESLLGERAFFMKEERLYSQKFRMEAGEFGLTPRGRVGLAVVGKKSDADEDLLS